MTSAQHTRSILSFGFGFVSPPPVRLEAAPHPVTTPHMAYPPSLLGDMHNGAAHTRASPNKGRAGVSTRRRVGRAQLDDAARAARAA